MEEYFGLKLIWDDFHEYSTYGIIMLATILIANVLKQRTKRLWIHNMIYVLGVMLLVGCNIFYSFSNFLMSPPSRYYFPSPNGNNLLLLEETGSIKHCVVSGYIVKGHVFKIPFSTVTFTKSDEPIKKGNYKIKWLNEKEVFVKVYIDNQVKSFSVMY